MKHPNPKAAVATYCPRCGNRLEPFYTVHTRNGRGARIVVHGFCATAEEKDADPVYQEHERYEIARRAE